LYAANISQLTAAKFAYNQRRIASTSNGIPQIIDPKEQQRKLEIKIDEEMETSSLVAEARLMGFSDDDIRNAMLRFECG